MLQSPSHNRLIIQSLSHNCCIDQWLHLLLVHPYFRTSVQNFYSLYKQRKLGFSGHVTQKNSVSFHHYKDIKLSVS